MSQTLCSPLWVPNSGGPTGLIYLKCLLSLITGCLRRGRVQTLMNKLREKWEGRKLEGKTEESIELWLHTLSLSQTLSNRISRSRLLSSLRLCCYGNVCSWSSHQLQIVSKWRREKKRKQSVRWWEGSLYLWITKIQFYKRGLTVGSSFLLRPILNIFIPIIGGINSILEETNWNKRMRCAWLTQQ